MAPKIKARLVRQLKAKGKSTQAAFAIAQSVLKKSGNVDSSGKATAKGEKRGNMTPSARAKDRAVKRSGGKPSDYTYNSKKNTTRKKPSIRQK